MIIIVILLAVTENKCSLISWCETRGRCLCLWSSLWFFNENIKHVSKEAADHDEDLGARHTSLPSSFLTYHHLTEMVIQTLSCLYRAFSRVVLFRWQIQSLRETTGGFMWTCEKFDVKQTSLVKIIGFNLKMCHFHLPSVFSLWLLSSPEFLNDIVPSSVQWGRLHARAACAVILFIHGQCAMRWGVDFFSQRRIYYCVEKAQPFVLFLNSHPLRISVVLMDFFELRVSNGSFT